MHTCVVGGVVLAMMVGLMVTVLVVEKMGMSVPGVVVTPEVVVNTPGVVSGLAVVSIKVPSHG